MWKLKEKLLRLFRKEPFDIHRELAKIQNMVDKACEKYEKNPNWHNAMYADEMLRIAERYVREIGIIVEKERKEREAREIEEMKPIKVEFT